MDRDAIDDLWQEFHTAVNMTSRELTDWLHTEAAGERTEALPEELAPEDGHRVLQILGKRKVDVTEDDAEVMQRVVDLVRAERGDLAELEPTAGDTEWRHRLMSVGHDPLKPAELGRTSGPGRG